MSFQAYLDTIKTQTGKSPEEFLVLAREKGLLEKGVKPMQIVNWLREDFGLGRGHAMALIVTFNASTQPKRSGDEQIGDHFKGKKTIWRKPYDILIDQVNTFGDDISVKPGNSYLSLLRSGKKFAVIQITAQRMDIGIKRKDTPATERFEAAGPWNSMVTHRVRITESRQIDAELLEWLRQAYDAI